MGKRAMSEPGVPPVVGVFGGSGVYSIEDIGDATVKRVDTPFGDPSGELVCGTIGGQQAVFLPRHGPAHQLPPTAINYRANIDALKRQGVTEILSIGAVGSLKLDYPPGHFVIVDQFIDRTHAREKSFFGAGCVAHVSMADPVCPRLAGAVAESLADLGVPHSLGGTYVAMEGPQFSSRAESELYRSWGCDVIGMTNMPEAKLAREAEICYVSVAMVTDYDCWHQGHEDVSVETILEVLHANADKAKRLVQDLLPRLSDRKARCNAGCHTALDTAVVTPPEARDPALLSKLDAVAGRIL